MVYEPMLVGSKPYRVGLCDDCDYQKAHCHKEIEILYVVSGELKVVLNNQPYVVKAGEMVFVPGMTMHFVARTGHAVRFLYLEIGPFFLGKLFPMVEKLSFTQPICKKSEKTEAVFKLLDEIISEKQQPTNEDELIIRGNLYKLTAEVHRLFPPKQVVKQNEKERFLTQEAEELIQNQYHTAVTVEEAAALCGYSVSSFCRIFKKAFGTSFHALLNEVRLEKAKLLLQDTTLTIAEIARQTGFADSKAFCRLFKKQNGMTATAFRQGESVDF